MKPSLYFNHPLNSILELVKDVKVQDSHRDLSICGLQVIYQINDKRNYKKWETSHQIRLTLQALG